MTSILILGGSGFLSGTMARCAVRDGHDVSVVTRGKRELPQGVRAIVADRKDLAAFDAAIANSGVARWDLVVDCIGYTPDDAAQDVKTFIDSRRTGHLVFISTDFVLATNDRPWRIDETFDRFETVHGYGKQKRAAEELLLARSRAPGDSRITILRPCHIYGPGSLLGCLPRHGRDAKLFERLRNGEPLALVGGGHFLQQPVFAADLWTMSLSCLGNANTHGEIYFAPGPDIVASRDFYAIVAELIGVNLRIEEVSITEQLREHPEHAPFCAHRVYSPQKAQSHGLKLPTTPLREGLRVHVESMLKES